MKTDYKVGDKVIAVTNGGYLGGVVSPGDELEVVEAFSYGCDCRVKNGKILLFGFEEIKPAPKHKYKVGDKVIITRNTVAHGFNIGDEVKIVELLRTGYWCHDANARWYVHYSNIKPAPKHDYKVGDKVLAVNNRLWFGVCAGDELEVVQLLDRGCDCRVKNGKVLYFWYSEIKSVELSISNSLINAIKSMPGVTMVSKTACEDRLIVEFEEEKPVIEDGIYVSSVGATLRIINGAPANSFNANLSGFKIGFYTTEDIHTFNFTPANDKQRTEHMQAEIDNGFWNKLNK